ncbi:MAG: protease modulator HflC [Proteobacteria bacterium]|nr:protease modulator HflC [Pseudomonadota bacterium]
MSKNILTILGIVVIALGIVAFNSMFTVHQTQQALVLQFGEYKRTITEPGLHFKMPILQQVIFFEKRVLNVDPPVERIILAGQKPLLVDAFARYHIADPLLFYQRVRNETVAVQRLGTIINAKLREILGGETLTTVLSGKRASIMDRILAGVKAEAADFGIDVIDVRIRRSDLPQKTEEAVYERMKSERVREAKEHRAEGAEAGQRIRAGADRDRTIILAEAQRKAQILSGEGDAFSYKIYADAFGQDPEFFAFYRSMQAYREAIGEDTTMVLSPDSDFFRFFGDPRGRRKDRSKGK